MVTHEPELAECADRIVTILDGKVCSNVVQDEETKKKNRDALFADLEGNLILAGRQRRNRKSNSLPPWGRCEAPTEAVEGRVSAAARSRNRHTLLISRLRCSFPPGGSLGVIKFGGTNQP